MSAEVFSPYASLSRRCVAYVLDLMILVIPCAIFGHLIPVVGGIIFLFFYAPVMEASEIRATPGKYLMGIQVTDLMGRRISLRAAVVRNIVKFISTILLCIGFFFALFTSKKQTLHDMLADTLVVYGRSERPIADAWMGSVRDVFHANGSGISGAAPADSISELERLQSLRERGALTEEEFQEQKRRILAR